MNTSHTYSTNGIVTVTVVITTGGCTDSVTGNVNVLLGTGVPSIQPLRMDIFPNPADEEISIVTHTQNEKIITVYNTLGVPVKTQIFQGTRYVLNIQDLDQGLYFVEVRDETLNRKGLRQIVVQ